MKRPRLSSSWDNRRQAVSHKVWIEGTNKFLLFTDETLSDLQHQIAKALKASHAGRT